MNCFELVRSVLDETYNAIPEGTRSRDQRVVDAIEAMSSSYRDVENRGGPDYGDPVVRFGYLYKYVTCHANLVAEALKARCLRDLFSLRQVSATCFGGGPGSEVLGVLKHLEWSESKPRLTFYICDRETAWMDAWSDLGEKVSADLTLHTNYFPHDACDSGTWKQTKHLRSDLFMLIYFMSELFHQKSTTEPYFDHVFSQAKPGSMILFIDNRGTDTTRWFERIAAAHDFEMVKSKDYQAKMPRDEQKDTLSEYRVKFGHFAKLDAEVSVRVAKKRV